MQGMRRDTDATSAATRQFSLATVLGLLVLASAAFALARYWKLDGWAREYARGFRDSPAYSSLNLALYGLLAWGIAVFFRRQILQAKPSWPVNGAFFGTIFGAALFGMTVWYGMACRKNPWVCAAGMAACSLIGASWAVIPTVLIRAFIEPFRWDMRTPWRAAAAGALVGAAAGYGSVFPIALWSVRHFLAFGLVPALFGAVGGARGAFLQAVSSQERGYLPASAFERIRITIDDLPDRDGVRHNGSELRSPERANDPQSIP